MKWLEPKCQCGDDCKDPIAGAHRGNGIDDAETNWPCAKGEDRALKVARGRKGLRAINHPLQYPSLSCFYLLVLTTEDCCPNEESIFSKE